MTAVASEVGLRRPGTPLTVPGGCEPGRILVRGSRLRPVSIMIARRLQSFETGQLVELTHFNAEAGKSYFFRTRQFSSRSSDLLELEQIDSDEAGYLISL